jgi:cell division protein FtsB
MDLKQGRTIFLAGFLALVVIWMIAFGSRIADLNRLTEENAQAQYTISALTATNVALKTEVAKAGSNAAVEEWAYERRKWIREGDIRIEAVIIEGTPAAPTPIPSTMPETQEPLRIWWELFFDTKP